MHCLLDDTGGTHHQQLGIALRAESRCKYGCTIVCGLRPTTSSSSAKRKQKRNNSIIRRQRRRWRNSASSSSMVASELEMSNVPFHILYPLDRLSVGQPIHEHCCTSTSSTSYRNDALAVVCDMSPLRHAREWTEVQAAPLLSTSNVPLYQVDAHNIVPVCMASPKREVGARTLRPGARHRPPPSLNLPCTPVQYCVHPPDTMARST